MNHSEAFSSSAGLVTGRGCATIRLVGAWRELTVISPIAHLQRTADNLRGWASNGTTAPWSQSRLGIHHPG